jgi:hypothetical protein
MSEWMVLNGLVDTATERKINGCKPDDGVSNLDDGFYGRSMIVSYFRKITNQVE